MRALNEQDYDQWFHQPVTQAFLELLRESRVETMELWSKEAFTGETPEATLQANIKALGGIAVLNDVIGRIEAAKAEPHPKAGDELNEVTD